MPHSIAFRAAAALTVLAGVSLSSAAQAETCAISFSVLKAGWVIGGSGGSGVLRCPGRSYPLSIGGVSWGILSARRKRGSTAARTSSAAPTTSPASMARAVPAARSASARN